MICSRIASRLGRELRGDSTRPPRLQVSAMDTYDPASPDLDAGPLPIDPPWQSSDLLFNKAVALRPGLRSGPREADAIATSPLWHFRLASNREELGMRVCFSLCLELGPRCSRHFAFVL
jgi:hypothetical protein